MNTVVLTVSQETGCLYRSLYLSTWSHNIVREITKSSVSFSILKQITYKVIKYPTGILLYYKPCLHILLLILDNNLLKVKDTQDIWV